MSVATIWLVEVSYEDEDPGTYGPYTERQAKGVERALRKEAELATDKHGITHHPHGLRGAIAYPAARYGDFVIPGGATFLGMRNAVRAANAAEMESAS